MFSPSALYFIIDFGFYYNTSDATVPPNKSHPLSLSHRYSPQSCLIRTQPYTCRAAPYRSPVLTAVIFSNDDVLQMQTATFLFADAV